MRRNETLFILMIPTSGASFAIPIQAETGTDLKIMYAQGVSHAYKFFDEV